LLAALVVGPSAAALAVGAAGPGARPAAAQEAAPDLGAQIDQVAGELAGVDAQIADIRAARERLDAAVVAAQRKADTLRSDASRREQVRADLVAQARAYAIQRYMYGSAGSRDLLAFLAALAKPADDAVWGLATLEVTSEAALDEAEQVAEARAAVEDRLASAQSDLLVLSEARDRKDQELRQAGARRAEVAGRFEVVVRELGQATVNGMSTVAYDAYRQAEATLAEEQPGCGLRWELLAAIGKTESNHGIGRLDAFGNSQIAIVGIPIGGDTDGGLLDGDSVQDHAVGPMQFIPSTWTRWGTDANGDGRADPGNIVDAATAAGRYLCRAAGDLTLTTEPGVIRAILSYNPNQTYLRVVGARFEALADDLAAGWFSAAALPPPPPPVPDVPANAGPDGRAAAGGTPAPPPPPPPTEVVEVKVFGAQDLATSTTAPVTIADGECLGPSLVLDGRAGFLRCRPQQPGTPVDVLDPCEPAPYDGALVGCLTDPTGVPTLLQVDSASTEDIGAAAPPPPYRLLVLDGGDRCLPVPAPEPAPAPPQGAGGGKDGGGRRNGATTTTTTAPDAPTTDAPGRRQQTTTTSTPAESTTSTVSTVSTMSTATTVPATTDPATTASTTTAAPTTTVPIAERTTYTCASGAVVVGLPDASTPTWTATVRQEGLADRRLPVVQAFS
jgi:membrane-bound lytic murein transglycosylase B